MYIQAVVLFLLASSLAWADHCPKVLGPMSEFNLSVLESDFNEPAHSDHLISMALAGGRIIASTETMHFTPYYFVDRNRSYRVFRGSDTQGSLLVAGDVYLKNYSVGHSVPRAATKVTAGGKIQVLNDQNTDPYAYLFAATSIHGGASKLSPHTRFDFDSAKTYAQELSRNLYRLPPNGKALIGFPYPARSVLVGDGRSRLQVFQIKASDLGHRIRTELFFQSIPSEATVVINVIPDVAMTQLTGNFDLTHQRSELLINFYTDEGQDYDLHVHKIQVPGSILAPNATVFFSTGLLEGQVVAKEFVGAGQVNWVPFQGRWIPKLSLPRCQNQQTQDQHRRNPK
jgi:choice-of-anchor A domain-containing protein